jgi:hypothetical protein
VRLRKELKLLSVQQMVDCDEGEGEEDLISRGAANRSKK